MSRNKYDNQTGAGDEVVVALGVKYRLKRSSVQATREERLDVRCRIGLVEEDAESKVPNSSDEDFYTREGKSVITS